MTEREAFRRLMRERRNHQPGTADHDYRTRACRKLVWMMRGVPASQWTE